MVHGILQARILEWGAFPFSKGSSQPRDWTQVSLIAGGFFTSWATRGAWVYWSRFPSPADLPDPGIEPGSPALQVDSLPTELSGKPLVSFMVKFLITGWNCWTLSVFQIFFFPFCSTKMKLQAIYHFENCQAVFILFFFSIFYGTKMSWIAYNSAEVLVFIIEGVRLSLWHP